MSNKPTFLLVPGNFLPSTYYDNVAKILRSHSFPIAVVTLLSTSSAQPLPSNEPDISAIRTTLGTLCNDGKEVIIVGHSYGGIISCEAAKGMGLTERQKQGQPGGVIKLIFVAAWLLREGENPPAITPQYDFDNSWLRIEPPIFYAADAKTPLFNDTTAEVADHWVPQATHSDITAFATPLQYAAWRHIPSTYLLCELDQCMPPSAQEGMLAQTEGKVKVVKLQSGHLPMLSMPEKFADALMSEADARP